MEGGMELPLCSPDSDWPAVRFDSFRSCLLHRGIPGTNWPQNQKGVGSESFAFLSASMGALANCILHVGMPKTGSSSIQDSFYLSLKDPGFRYISITANPNGADFLQAMFRDDPTQFWMYNRMGYTAQKLQQFKKTYEDRLRRALRRIRASGATAILSSEDCWLMNPAELTHMKKFLTEENFNVRVIAYLRPIKSWIESALQQNMKYNGNFSRLEAIVADSFLLHRIDYERKLEIFSEIFGRDNLIVRPFVRHALFGGCAVRDFCEHLGISFDPKEILRTNDALCADAVKILYAFNQFGRANFSPSLADNHLMLMYFSDLKGQPFRLHSSLFEPLRDLIERQNEAMISRYGIDLREDLYAADKGSCIRNGEDLMRFSEDSLAWLSSISRRPLIQVGEGEVAAQAVAKQVVSLAKRRSIRMRMKRLRTNLHLQLHGRLQPI